MALIRAYKAQPFQPYPEFLERLRHNLRSAGFSQRPQVLVKQCKYLYFCTIVKQVFRHNLRSAGLSQRPQVLVAQVKLVKRVSSE